MRRRPSLRDERGTTLVELMVATASGMVIMFAITTVIVVALHSSARVSARVDATQRGRIVIARIMEQLHSACVLPEIAPVQEGSTGTKLRFVHQTGSGVALTPTLSVINFENGTLKQFDYKATAGPLPSWTFEQSPFETRTLLTKVAPISPASSLFYYYSYSNGSLVQQAGELSSTAAKQVLNVRVALTSSPTSAPVADSGAPSSIQDSATFRLTPPSFNEKAISLPCQ
jgi:type II secretory pathway component PulJ